ncbi:putative receptor-like protein kinase At3g47110 [Brachypodium distachyon]|uniref:Receptor kinase-like protein Xa21 n=2 Tax=Brachypodium distachyon TaxID=15368 RepID=I1IN58_BRADI|nr:putative receptor-like protein kinase At3g47110 [Brachypodium distachyon]KQJ89251.1 hypothetical protein BRADI_4g24457v3 [Brachypodium distachyon]|eukprot:XP_014758877.1 putative receptor-like protein kinase At3g47110 [Brachypodium distachyon]
MKVTPIIRLFFMVLMASCANIVNCSSLSGNETDRLSLIEFKKAISFDLQQALISWNDSIPFCNWEGVRCTMKNPCRVTSLDLTNRGLVGQISPSLGNLSFLQNLHLPKNAFAADIPPSLGHLRRLRYLYLTNNTLQGRIPNFANCSHLKVLWLDRNNLVGQIPTEWPPNLQELNLANNNLSGTIPPSLANITTLESFHCGLNNLVGNVPNSFAKFSRQKYLFVSANRLTGRFQQAILNISTLVDLSLTENQITGELPSNLGNHLPNLQRLFLAANLFQGYIPNLFITASKLTLLDMSRNNFTGVVPSSIGKLTKLSWLNLEFNKLETHNKQDWKFRDSLANCTELQIFSIHGNRLEGHVPASLGNLSVNLRSLYLGDNELSGNFPAGLATLPNLNLLELQRNHFTGMVPEWIGNLKNLQQILLHGNKFTGFIPESVSNLSLLVQIFLDSNKFGGHLPPSLGNLQMLQTFSIFNNSFIGGVPKKIFQIPTLYDIDLSFNNLVGQLRTDIGNAKQLVNLALSSNKLSGDVPNTLGNCESLENILFGSNIFSGSIPISLGNIRSLKVLNFSDNNLSGPIPAYLGNLKLLEKLDLSFNHLEGEVPKNGIFSNATAIKIDANHRLYGGIQELHLLACSVMRSNLSKYKLSFVLKLVIPVVSMVSLVMVIVLQVFWRRKHKKRSLSLPSYGQGFPKVSFIDLARATDGFSTAKMIGRGSYGAVYEGKLFPDGNYVAIKVFNLETTGSQKSFIAECNALRSVRHRNLVHVLTACSSIDSNGNDFKALVYEFMPRGDLHKLLYSIQDESTSELSHITVAQRLSIVVDVADALEYLHHNSQETIVHCDMKPSNILLDDNLTAHVGDFGLAKFKVDSVVPNPADPYSTSSIAIRGTIGYVAPECATGGHVSSASDVYSFGIVLLEIFLRKRPTDDMFKDGLNIAKFVEMNFLARIAQIIDPELLQDPAATKESYWEFLVSMLNIGLCCTKLSPNERPMMQEVAPRLHGIKDSYLRGN